MIGTSVIWTEADSDAQSSVEVSYCTALDANCFRGNAWDSSWLAVAALVHFKPDLLVVQGILYVKTGGDNGASE